MHHDPPGRPRLINSLLGGPFKGATQVGRTAGDASEQSYIQGGRDRQACQADRRDETGPSNDWKSLALVLLNVLLKESQTNPARQTSQMRRDGTVTRPDRLARIGDFLLLNCWTVSVSYVFGSG